MIIKNPRIAIFDLDNTLYDWVGYFVPSFYAMIDKVIQITECDRDKLLNEFKEVHQKFGDTEHPFSFLETGIFKELQQRLGRESALHEVDGAFHAFNSARKRSLVLYDGALDIISYLAENGVSLIAYTESSSFASVDRLSRLGIIDYFDGIYCRTPGGSLHPNSPDMEVWTRKIRKFGIVEFSPDHRKPAPEILQAILSDCDMEPADAFYVGDSLAKDVVMAKKANIFAIWAKYGTVHDVGDFDRLVKVSHWTSADIEREQKLKKDGNSVLADFVAESGPRDIKNCIVFEKKCNGSVTEPLPVSS